MRARKVKIPLSLESVLSTLIPGRAYTLSTLALLYEGGAEAIQGVLQQAMTMGAVECSGGNRGWKNRYWLVESRKVGVAERRWQAADMTGPLQGYDLMRLATLCNTFRRS